MVIFEGLNSFLALNAFLCIYGGLVCALWLSLIIQSYPSLTSQKNFKTLTEHGEQFSLQKQDRKNILASLQDHAKCNYKQILWLYNHFVSNST